MGASREGQGLTNWVIGIGIAGALGLWWWASGTPGIGDIGQEIYDGTWSCSTGGGQGLGAMYGPGLTVENGEITSAWHFDTSTGREVPAPFSNVRIVSPTELTLDSTYPLGNVTGSFTCTKG